MNTSPASHAHASDQPVARERIVELIRDARNRGVKLWPEGGRLRCEMPKGALSRDEVELLKRAKGEIITLLQQSSDQRSVSAKPTRRGPMDRVPLTLLQLLHWKTIRSNERLCQRATASALRLTGRLSLEVLQRSVQQLVNRHEALRTRIGLVDGQPSQWVLEPSFDQLQVHDLTAMPSTEHDAEVRRLIAACIREPVDPAVDPLFVMRLIKLRDTEHVLLMAMEHIVSDGSSLNLLWRDLFEIYVRALQGLPSSLPEIPVQFPDYAVWQNGAYKPWSRKRGRQWNALFKDAHAAAFPSDPHLQENAERRWARMPIHIGPQLKGEWQEWCRQNRTTLPLSALAVYAALILRWCNSSACVLQYQTTGRLSAKLENTVGLFAVPICLPVTLRESDTLVDLLKQVTAVYCQTYAMADFNYLAAQVPRPEWSRTPALNWIPQSRPLDLASTDSNAIAVHPVEFENPVYESFALDADPAITFVETDQAILGSVQFPMHLFSEKTMRRFSQLFETSLTTLIRAGLTPVKDIPF
jgi:hypothetical protein